MQVANLEDVYRLSPLQQEKLSRHLRQLQNDGDLVQVALVLSGPLRPTALKQAWDRVAAQQALLRTSFRWEGLREPFQLVHRRVELSLEVHDWRGREADVPRFLEEDRTHRLDPSHAPLLRLALLQTGPEEHVLVCTHHRLLLDSWSAVRIAAQVLTVYEALAGGESRELERSLPFRDYVDWTRRQDLAETERFWRRELADPPPPAPPGCGEPLPGQGGFRARAIRLAPAATALLGSLARSERLTLETLVQGAWALLLSRRAGAQDVLFGITVSGRSATLPGAEFMAGPLLQALPLRVAVAPEAPLLSWLHGLQERQAAVQRHGYVPLSQVREWSGATGGAPLFHSQVVFDSLFERRSFAGVDVREIRLIEPFDHPVTLAVQSGTELALTMIYDGSRCHEAEVFSLQEHVQALLESIAADPLRSLSEVEAAARRPAQVPPLSGPGSAGVLLTRQPVARAPSGRPGPVEESGSGWSEIVPVPRDQPLPATFYQEWALQLDGVETNSLPIALGIEGQVDLAALRRSLAEIVRRHESLRTSFRWNAGEARLLVAPPGEVPLPLVDLAALPEDRRTELLQRLTVAHADHAFDLARGPLFVAQAVRLGEREHALLLNVHHLVSDGWSLQILLRELFILYRAFVQNQPSPLPPLPIQAPDFAHWQRRVYAGESLGAHLAWWRRNLANLSPPPPLPIDRPRPETVGPRAVQAVLELAPEITQALRALAVASQCSLAMVLLAAADALLYTYSGQEDLVVSSIFAARNRRELIGLIGLFMNTVPVRVNLSGNPTIRGLTGRVRDAMIEAYAHQDVPFPRVLAEVFPGRKVTRTSLTGVCFNMLSFARPTSTADAARPEDGLAFRAITLGEEITKHDLTFTGQELETGVRFLLQGAADLFQPAGIAAVARRFEALLAQIAADPDIPLDRLRLNLQTG